MCIRDSLFIFHFAILGTLTPPVSLAAFAAAGIAGSNPMKTGISALKLALPGFLIPYFFVMNPTLVGQGAFVEIAIDMITAVIGVFFMDYAIEGFIKRKLNVIMRILCVVSGVLLIYPSYTVSMIGLAIAVVIIVIERISRKNDAGKAAA